MADPSAPAVSMSDVAGRGIAAVAAYLPHWRLQRSAIAEVLGSSAGKGTRTVASYDEDAVTMAVEAGRRVMRSADVPVEQLWFASTSGPYSEKTAAPIVHAALRLDGDVLAADAGPGLRGAAATLRAALRSVDPGVLVTAGDVRTGPAGSSDEQQGGDAGAAVLVAGAGGGDV
ncbi:MAG: hydroxymethylglutaryl-CoA synthase, partial [Actinobacteria bacterium]|nr:hydroxymethylglutaryl-CoA synthase [Actinomycetota bacterium]